MKTKITRIAASLFAAAIVVPSAFAGMGVPRFDNWGSDTQKSAPQAEACKGSSCCTTKVEAGNPLGRSGQASATKVRACEKSCKIPAKDQKEACKKGSHS
jgi:hypothetical protein